MERPYVITAGIHAVEHAIELFSESIQDTSYVDSKLEDNARALMDLLEFHQGYTELQHLYTDKGQWVMDTSDGDVVVVDEAMPVYDYYRPLYGQSDDIVTSDLSDPLLSQVTDVVELGPEEMERLWPSDRR